MLRFLLCTFSDYYSLTTTLPSTLKNPQSQTMNWGVRIKDAQLMRSRIFPGTFRTVGSEAKPSDQAYTFVVWYLHLVLADPFF